MNTKAAEYLETLFADHDALLDALGEPWFWSRVFAAESDGAEAHGTPVRPTGVEPVGTGQVASCLRVTLEADSAEVPPSVVVKTASAEPSARSTSAALRHGEIEVGFYNVMSPGCRARVPGCHLAALSQQGDDFIVVLEDMADHTQADQILGMSPEAAGRAVDELANLHASWWGEVPPGASEFLVRPGVPSAHAAVLAMLKPGFEQRYADRLSSEALELTGELVARAEDYLGNREGQTAVVHGDFRPDNLLVGPERVAVVDWQTVTIGPPLADLAYFIGGALSAQDWPEHSSALVERYRTRLGGHGIELDPEELDLGVRRYALDGLVMAIGASQVVGQTDRGDEMFIAMAERSAAHATAAGTLDMI